MGQYSEVFCKVYNEFGWNYYPEAFGEQLLQWLALRQISVRSAMDLACGTGVLCRILKEQGIDAAGMDFSEGMIAIAREESPDIPYDVADMITYRPERKFDLVTCTGDALNHIMDTRDVRTILENVYGYLSDGGWLVFDILNEAEVSTDEPFDLDFSDTIRARFQMLRQGNWVNLKTQVFENGEFQFEENICEALHDPAAICRILEQIGFRKIQCSHHLLPDSPPVATWYVTAQK